MHGLQPGLHIVGSSFRPRARFKREGLALTGGLGVGEGLHVNLSQLLSVLTSLLPVSGSAVRIPPWRPRPQIEIARLISIVW